MEIIRCGEKQMLVPIGDGAEDSGIGIRIKLFVDALKGK
jgi:hypothetical protein